jgi:hypothetical protein
MFIHIHKVVAQVVIVLQAHKNLCFHFLILAVVQVVLEAEAQEREMAAVAQDLHQAAAQAAQRLI